MTSLMKHAMKTAGKDLKLSTAQPETKPRKDEFDDGFGDLDFDEPIDIKPATKPQQRGVISSQPTPMDSGSGLGRQGGLNQLTSASNTANKLENFAQKDTAPRNYSESMFDSKPVAAPKAVQGTSKLGASWMEDNQSEIFNAKEFANTFFAQLEDFTNLRHRVPEDIMSFNQYAEEYKLQVQQDVRLDLKLQLEYLNAELQQTLSQLRSLERAAEQAASIGKDKRSIVSILYERKDAQNKVALLNSKKTGLLSLHEALEVFEDLAEIGQTYDKYQKVVGKFLDKNKIDIGRPDPDPLVHTSLAYQLLHQQSKGLAVDKEPVTDYMCLEYAEAEGAAQMRQQIEREYKILMEQNGK